MLCLITDFLWHTKFVIFSLNKQTFAVELQVHVCFIENGGFLSWSYIKKTGLKVVILNTSMQTIDTS